MKRLERLGTVAFLTVMLAFIFHVLAMSYNHWKDTKCLTCSANDPLGSWSTSMGLRCYYSSVASIFINNDSAGIIPNNSFVTQVCLPNQFLKTKHPKYAGYCLSKSSQEPDTICSIGNYDSHYCSCE